MPTKPALRSQYFDYVTAVSFRRDDVQLLAGSDLYKGFLGTEWEHTDPAKLLETEPAVSSKAPPDLPRMPWDILRGIPALHCTYPHVFKPRLRLRVAQEKVQKGGWKSVKAECLVNAIGIGVHLRFGFDDWQREDAVSWGYDTEFCLLGKDGHELWRGRISGLCLKTATTTLAALGIPWSALRTDDWGSRMGNRGTLRQIYTELREINKIEKNLLYGLATGAPGWRTMTQANLDSALWRRPLLEGEVKCFTRKGCAMVLNGSDVSHWGQANCYRRNVVGALMLHQMAYDHFRILYGELDGGGDRTPEWDAVLSGGVHERLTRSRLTLLMNLHEKIDWLCYYSGADLSRYIDKVAEADYNHQIVSPGIQQDLRRQLNGYLRAEERPQGPAQPAAESK